MNKKIVLSISLLFILACATTTPPQAIPSADMPIEKTLTITKASTSTQRVLTAKSETPSAVRFTRTATITPSPIPTSTSTKSFLTSPQPMEIEVMRLGEYLGSDIFVESELGRGSNYSQYYVYYLSQELKIYALLTVPDGTPPTGGFPAIIFNHGYIPPEQYRTTQNYESYVDALAKSGFVVFRIDYRGHDQSEGTARSAYGYPDYTIDVLNAINTIKRHASVNPDKIGMWGHSMGGFLTLRAMVISKDIKVGVIWAGVVAPYPDLLSKWTNYDTIPHQLDNGLDWKEQFLAQYGAPGLNPKLWANFSANSYLADLSGPLQIHHGTGDEVVPYEFSTVLADEAEKAGKTADLLLYDGDNHNISNSFNAAMTSTIEFFIEYLNKP